MTVQATFQIIIAQTPSSTTKDKICFSAGFFLYRFGEAYYFIGHFLLGGAGDLLPFERDEIFIVIIIFRQDIQEVASSIRSFPNEHLGFVTVSPIRQRRQYHRFQNAACSRIARSTHASPPPAPPKPPARGSGRRCN